jgi:hypothetical protein
MKQLLSKRIQAHPSASKRIQALVIFMFVFTFANAQNSFFNYLPTPALISADQQAELDKAIARFPDAPRWVATANTFESSHQNGLVYLSDPEGGANSTLTFKFKSVEYYSEQEYVWYGQLQSGGIVPDEDGELFLSKHDGVLNGSFQIGERLYEITDLGSERYLIQKTPKFISTCEPLIPPSPLPIPSSSPTSEEVEERGTNCDVRVLVLISQAAADAGKSNMANTFVNYTNSVFTNSNIFSSITKLVLIDGAPTVVPSSVYSETGSSLTMNEVLSSLATPNSSLSNFATPIAITKGADIVVFLINRSLLSNPTTTAGIAYLGGGGSSLGLSVVDAYSTGRVFAHEVGHLYGCNHERCSEEDPGPNCLPAQAPGINRANVFYVPNSGGSSYKRTMMYSQVHPDMIPHFSNPFVSYLGVPTGAINISDNATVIRSGACRVANYRTTSQPPLSLKVDGPNFACPDQTVGFWAQLDGTLPPSGNQTPSTTWQSSTDGINFSSSLGNSSYYSFVVPPTTQEYMLFLRVTVTLSNGQTLSATHYLLIKTCTGNRFDGTQESKTGLSVFISPNPISTGQEISVSIKGKQTTDTGNITILDSKGSIVSRLNNFKIGEDYTNMRIPTTNLPSGIYFLVVDANGEQVYHSILVNK